MATKTDGLPVTNQRETPVSRIDPIRRRSTLADDLFAQILRRILSGEYPEQSRLPTESEFAEAFQVSRPVVREALAKLRDDDLVYSRRGSGSYVKRRPGDAMLRFAPVGSIADIQRCFEFRAPLESEAAAVAAERRSEESLELIAHALTSLDHAIETQQIGADADFAFHLAIARATGNPFYVATMSSMQEHIAVGINVNRHLSLLLPTERLQAVQAEHIEVYEAIRAGDSKRARVAMRRHIDNDRRRVFEGQAQ